ncbi:hypothetical protein BTU63_05475 [Streptococcus rubneri]|nr:hypothetical protein [Streptococcus rubneri]
MSGLYYADFISYYSPTQLCGGGTTKSNSNELPISVPLSFLYFIANYRSILTLRVSAVNLYPKIFNRNDKEKNTPSFSLIKRGRNKCFLST